MARILIVDDEPDIRYMMRLIFEAEGHSVMEARHGGDGLSLARATPPDLVVTDLMMPMMDGLEFIDRLRSDPKTEAIPVLVVSANSGLAKARAATLPKPFLPGDLLKAAGRLIRKNGG